MTYPVVYMPGEPARPAPPILTASEAALLLRLEGNAEDAMKRLRDNGKIRARQIGKHCRYLIADVLKCAEDSE